MIKARKGGKVMEKVVQKRPLCPYHGTQLNFSAAELTWTCPTEGCTTKKYPKTLLEEQGGYPIVGKGRLDVMKYTSDGEDTYVLRASGNNVVLDITDMISEIEEHPSTYVTIAVDKIIELDGFKKV